jgi:hypothetical protein
MHPSPKMINMEGSIVLGTYNIAQGFKQILNNVLMS